MAMSKESSQSWSICALLMLRCAEEWMGNQMAGQLTAESSERSRASSSWASRSRCRRSRSSACKYRWQSNKSTINTRKPRTPAEPQAVEQSTWVSLSLRQCSSGTWIRSLSRRRPWFLKSPSRRQEFRSKSFTMTSSHQMKATVDWRTSLPTAETSSRRIKWKGNYSDCLTTLPFCLVSLVTYSSS